MYERSEIINKYLAKTAVKKGNKKIKNNNNNDKSNTKMNSGNN